MPNHTSLNSQNSSTKYPINLIASIKLIIGLSVLAVMAFATKLIFDDRGWAVSIAIANVFFLIVIRVIPYESLVGINELNKYWGGNKNKKIKLIIPKSTCESRSDLLISTTPAKIVPVIESHSKTLFLIKDSVNFITSFKSELVNIIATNVFFILIILFSNFDNKTFSLNDSKLTQEAIAIINDYKEMIGVLATISIVSLQAVLLLKVPLLIDNRNKIYLSEQKAGSSNL